MQAIGIRGVGRRRINIRPHLQEVTNNRYVVGAVYYNPKGRNPLVPYAKIKADYGNRVKGDKGSAVPFRVLQGTASGEAGVRKHKN